MNAHRPRVRHRQEGIAWVLAILCLVLLSGLAAAMLMQTSAGVQISSNHGHVARALLAAESGLSFMLQQLDTLQLSPDTTPDTFTANLRDALDSRFSRTELLNGSAIEVIGGTVVVPEIICSDGAFQSSFELVSPERARIRVRGRHDEVTRTIAMEFAVVRRMSAVFDYGLASRGQVTISGNTSIRGVNDPNEASVLSVTSSNPDAIRIDGSVTIDGDLAVSAEASYVSISGSPTIAGSSDPAVIAEHIHTGAEAPVFPAPNTAQFAELPTQTIDGNTDLNSQDLVLNNICIKAGTNPTFTRDVTLNGIVLVESPNIVRFEGKARLNGMLVTEEGDQPIESCQIHFAGHVEAREVETLPSLPEYEAIKEYTGTFILAPGFGVTFAGNVSAINGTIAADQLTFTGTAEGLVKGAVIGLKDLPTSLSGNVEIRVDRSGSDPNPAGFIQPVGLSPEFDSYVEIAGG